jgi:5-(carboxyamino)imidazole ribonucleotide mutase
MGIYVILKQIKYLEDNIMKKVAIIMGSDSDLPVVTPAIKQLAELGIETEVRVMSAHRTPEAAHDFSKNAIANGFGVIIAAAGMAAHLGGVLAASTTLPVIGIPCSSKVLDGMDALLSTVMMPPGIPVATVGVNAGKNAALLAAEILAVNDTELQSKLIEMRKEMALQVESKDKALQDKIKEL